jgi:hypothetical protein
MDEHDPAAKLRKLEGRTVEARQRERGLRRIGESRERGVAGRLAVLGVA